MRTTKRFTPQLLRRWNEIGRGSGTGDEYSPWHQVSRGDPASRGRSHLLARPGSRRFTNLLSDGELTALFFAQMLPDVIDITEQYPLAFETTPHELSRYSVCFLGKSCEGTAKIAADLGIKHPVIYCRGDRESWTPSTDLVVVRSTDGICSLVTIAVKQIEEIQKRRTEQLLNLEREYWLRRGAQWLLITPAQYDSRVGLTLSRTAPWAFSRCRANKAQQVACAKIVKACEGRTFVRILEELEVGLNLITLHAQCAFWQSVWNGIIPLDLRLGHRSNELVQLLSHDDFIALNPIRAGRSAWPNS